MSSLSPVATKLAASEAAVVAQAWLDKLQTSISAEAEMVARVLGAMDFNTLAVPGPMLTGAWRPAGRSPAI